MNISKSVTKKDHYPKISGEALYVGDHLLDNAFFGRFIRSTKARAKILGITVPVLPENYFYVDKNDVPGENRVHIVQDDTPIFAEETVEYIGDPIGMLIGPEEEKLDELLKQVVVQYEDLVPVLKIEDSDIVFYDYNYGKGNIIE